MESRKRTLVLMAGLPGSGKTTLAKKLCDGPEWFLVDKDECLDRFLDGNHQYSEDNLKCRLDYEDARKKAYDEAFNKVGNKLNNGISVILDSALLDDIALKRAKKIVKECKNVQLKIILCIIADRMEREERMRNKTPRVLTYRLDPTTRKEYLHNFKHLSSEDYLELDTSKSIGECLKDARNYLLVEGEGADNRVAQEVTAGAQALEVVGKGS